MIQSSLILVYKTYGILSSCDFGKPSVIAPWVNIPEQVLQFLALNLAGLDVWIN